MSALMIRQRPIRRQLAGAFTLSFHKLRQSRQIVGGGREGEGPSDAFAAAELGSLLARDSLDPAKGLFDSLADALADRIARDPLGMAVGFGQTTSTMRPLRFSINACPMKQSLASLPGPLR